MTSEFHLTPRFDRTLRKLKKRYPKINTDLVSAFTRLEENPEAGVVIPDDFMIRKLRVASIDMQRGKSGGFRLLYKLLMKDTDDLQIVLLFIFAKTDQADVPLTFLETLDEDMPEENE